MWFQLWIYVGSIILSFLSHFSYYENDPSCKVSVDETIDACASQVTLKVDEGFSNYTWNSGVTEKSITVNTSGTYYWETINMTDNKVVNGSFENTDHYSGFSSSYQLNPTSLLSEGTYAVVTDPNRVHHDFAQIGDHTSGTGYMMVVNGSKKANVSVWQESVTVSPNTDYIFSIWATSVNPANPGVLTFSINGRNIGNIILSEVQGQWQNFTARWTSGSGDTRASIGIVNQNIVASGNDFAIDDIQFGSVCRKTFYVRLHPSPPKPGIDPI